MASSNNNATPSGRSYQAVIRRARRALDVLSKKAHLMSAEALESAAESLIYLRNQLDPETPLELAEVEPVSGESDGEVVVAESTLSLNAPTEPSGSVVTHPDGSQDVTIQPVGVTFVTGEPTVATVSTSSTEATGSVEPAPKKGKKATQTETTGSVDNG
jgi:hypothetical protein